MKVLVDTNVWLDVLAHREPFCTESKAALMACIEDDHSIHIAATSLKDIFYLLDKALGNQEAYEAVKSIFEIADIVPIDEFVCKTALHHERPDFEDGLIAAAALAERIDLILSRDRDAFQNLDIPCLAPAEFLAQEGYEEIDFF